jgi:hypothetical protein
MRQFLYILLFSFGVSLTAQAQTPPQGKPSPEKPSQEIPAKDASKPEQSETVDKAEPNIDLDSFFKKGEENAKNGASCNMPATPADPVA